VEGKLDGGTEKGQGENGKEEDDAETMRAKRNSTRGRQERKREISWRVEA
jgi:hypothetical protein